MTSVLKNGCFVFINYEQCFVVGQQCLGGWKHEREIMLGGGGQMKKMGVLGAKTNLAYCLLSASLTQWKSRHPCNLHQLHDSMPLFKVHAKSRHTYPIVHIRSGDLTCFDVWHVPHTCDMFLFSCMWYIYILYMFHNGYQLVMLCLTTIWLVPPSIYHY